MTSLPRLKNGAGSPEKLGATFNKSGTNFAIIAQNCTKIAVCFFDADDHQIAQIEIDGHLGDVHFGFIENVEIGAKYGFRAWGGFDANLGLFFDPNKLLLDPYAKRIDRPFSYVSQMCLPAHKSVDTAKWMPKSLVTDNPAVDARPVKAKPGGLTYELNVRGFSKNHPGIPLIQRGTIAALAHPDMVAYFTNLRVTTIELMPVSAWIDERHLAALGLSNAWGYNPVSYFAPDPRLMPGGIEELRQVSDIYREKGISVILDVVYNHTGESDLAGPTLSFKGLAAQSYYWFESRDDGRALVNDSGCGNTLNCANSSVQNLVIDSLVHWVLVGGVSGFRFDLAPILGRNSAGFSAHAEMLARIRNHPILKECTLIAEPWDPGPGGYQLGAFGSKFLEWNDQYRDDLRKFWRGDGGMLGNLATRLSGSSDVFCQAGDRPSRGVNFIAAHDGFTLRDLVSFAEKHNFANGENNADGHSNNLSWNNGVEGISQSHAVIESRTRDVKALLASLFCSRGNIMVCAGDEFGRTQGGNNNAYAQDNDVTWLDWVGADETLRKYVEKLSRFRLAHPAITKDNFLTGAEQNGVRDVVWLHPNAHEMQEQNWQDATGRVLGMHLNIDQDEVLIWFNGGRDASEITLPDATNQNSWEVDLASDGCVEVLGADRYKLPPRCVVAFVPKASNQAQ